MCKMSVALISGIVSMLLFSNLLAPTHVAAQDMPSSSRQKVYTWDPMDVLDGGGIVASKIRNMTVTIIEERAPNGTLSTRYVTTWQFYNVTHDDRTGSHLGVVVTLRDQSGQLLEEYTGSSPRADCSYDGNWGTAQIPTVHSSNNYLDVISGASAQVSYGATYEGTC
ncbi:hypothetical protein BTHE68_40140 [Burkholderia sp. THE68]|nr:hypothetical protein BTHE68_40140 [Burkholderia sp. THE68]